MLQSLCSEHRETRSSRHCLMPGLRRCTSFAAILGQHPSFGKRARHAFGNRDSVPPNCWPSWAPLRSETKIFRQDRMRRRRRGPLRALRIRRYPAHGTVKARLACPIYGVAHFWHSWRRQSADCLGGGYRPGGDIQVARERPLRTLSKVGAQHVQTPGRSRL